MIGDGDLESMEVSDVLERTLKEVKYEIWGGSVRFITHGIGPVGCSRTDARLAMPFRWSCTCSM